MERRDGAKENAELQSTVRTQSRAAVSQAQARIREAVIRNRQDKLTALLHHLTVDVLRASFFGLKRSAAPGVDEVTWTEYAEGHEENLSDLHTRVQTGAYRALPTRRAYIPKADGRQRPLGIGRVLNDGTTQLTQCSYNSVGNLTEITYPTGQTFNFIYAANGIDLVLVQQVTDNGPVTIAPRQSGIVVRLAQAACMVGSQPPLFAGTPGSPNCHGESVSALAQQYGGLDAAATARNYPTVRDLQNAIATYCAHSG